MLNWTYRNGEILSAGGASLRPVARAERSRTEAGAVLSHTADHRRKNVGAGWTQSRRKDVRPRFGRWTHRHYGGAEIPRGGCGHRDRSRSVEAEYGPDPQARPGKDRAHRQWRFAPAELLFRRSGDCVPAAGIHR